MRLGEKGPATPTVRWVASWTAITAISLLCLFGCGQSSPVEKGTKPASSTDSSSVRPTSGKELYALHCAACHGQNGDGKGVAAAFLFPKPRDFRAGRFRLVSTANNVPTREDLHAVLLRGMPGSSMPPWKHLKQTEREALVDEVLLLREEGAREFYTDYLKDEEELTEEELAEDEVQEEIEDYVQRFTTPGESRSVPVIEASDVESIARGSDVYFKQGCHACHGQKGKGDGVQAMVDAEGLPTSPRDFTLGIFKGNHDPVSLFYRTAYGMPGTPMPSSSSLKPEEVVDLVHFVHSLSSEEDRLAAIMNRGKIVAKIVDALPASLDSNTWSDAAPVDLRVLPLWWRNDIDLALQVQALHDGKTLAVRISWKDESQDEHAIQGEAFEDAVAMELYRGNAEPFLGMGSMDQSVDVWFWDADRQTSTNVEDQYPNIVVDSYPFSEDVVSTAGYDRKGTSREEQPSISLPAVAVRNQITPGKSMSGGSDLAVGGPGSVTFRIPKNQHVTATGEWKEGRWTVVMRRALSVGSPDEGVSLEPGENASVAFAIWNGSRRDRDGQKLITIWQDLKLEK